MIAAFEQKELELRDLVFGNAPTTSGGISALANRHVELQFRNCFQI